MGDGTKTGKGITLQTQSYTIKENVYIMAVLDLKFNIRSTIHMQRALPTIYIKTQSVKKIYPYLSSYIIDSMKYKFSI